MTIHEEVSAALNRLQAKNAKLKEQLQNAYGYAVFPSVGRASAVLGGAYGHGEVFERGKPVGFATMSQITVGVQIGGQTFIQILTFRNRDALDQFKKRGKVGFTLNASAVIVKAAATATNNVADMEAKAYSRGGMLLEASVGGSKFMFVPPLQKLPPVQEQPKEKKTENRQVQFESLQSKKGEKATERSSERTSRGFEIGHWAKAQLEKVSKVLPHDGKNSGSPLSKVADLVSGANKEIDTNRVMKKDVEAILKMVEEAFPDFKKALDQAYGYAIFPSVGRAGLVFGGAYGKGEVFEQKKLIGYAGITQLTIGVQVGGETCVVMILFSDKDGLERFKQGKVAFTANAGAVIVKAGAEKTTKYRSDNVYIISEGGLLLEAAIGGQKVIYRSAALTRNQKVE